jgi:hypothetical protein
MSLATYESRANGVYATSPCQSTAKMHEQGAGVVANSSATEDLRECRSAPIPDR